MTKKNKDALDRDQRNAEIYEKYLSGYQAKELRDEYGLSLQEVNVILFSLSDEANSRSKHMSQVDKMSNQKLIINLRQAQTIGVDSLIEMLGEIKRRVQKNPKKISDSALSSMLTSTVKAMDVIERQSSKTVVSGGRRPDQLLHDAKGEAKKTMSELYSQTDVVIDVG